ncbi:MAG: fkbM [Chthonomonadaceae bacterium]|nr:fkbM [Chthonomonadaceae bacterium]
MELTSSDYHKALNELQPRVTNYGWMISLLRARIRQVGYFPLRIYRLLKKFANPNRPYFIGTTPQGIRYVGDYRDEYSLSWSAYDHYDHEIVQFLTAQMKHCRGAYLDIGANMGVTAALAARELAGREQVFAFEPLPVTAQRAAATFALNDLKNVRLFQAALSDADSEITFYSPEGHSEIASAHRNGQMEWMNVQEVRVPSVRLDTILDKETQSRVGLIKIDVEGHEIFALRGGSKMLARDQPPILYEYCPTTMVGGNWDDKDMVEFLSTVGDYGLRVLNHDNTWSDFPPPPNSAHYVNVFCEARKPI